MKIKTTTPVKKIFEILKGEHLKLFRNSQNLTSTHTDCEHGMLNNKIVVNSSIDHVLVTYQ